MTELLVVLQPTGPAQVGSVRWRLHCGPPGGSHPRPGETCAELARHPAALGRARRACLTKATPGTPLSTVTGSFAGAAVDRQYRPGCPDWEALHLLLTGH